VPDPLDGRAKIVRLTPRGQQAAHRGSEIIRNIEHDWAASLGQDDMDQLRSLLERLTGQIGEHAQR
jgi:DNA-binding MarR family transcriptional regulator